MPSIPPVIRDIWREASDGFYVNPKRVARRGKARTARHTRSAYNTAHPGMLPHAGKYNRGVKTRIDSLQTSADVSYALAMKRPNQLQVDRDRAANVYASKKKIIDDKMHNTRNVIIAAINAEIQAAEMRYETTVAALWPWQFIKKASARRKRYVEVKMARWKARRIPLFIKTVKERHKLRRERWDERRIYKSYDATLKSTQKIDIDAADAAYKAATRVIRAEKITARRNTRKNDAHMFKKSAHNIHKSGKSIFHEATALATGIRSGFVAGAREAGSRTGHYLSTRPIVMGAWHVIQKAFT